MSGLASIVRQSDRWSSCCNQQLIAIKAATQYSTVGQATLVIHCASYSQCGWMFGQSPSAGGGSYDSQISEITDTRSLTIPSHALSSDLSIMHCIRSTACVQRWLAHVVLYSCTSIGLHGSHRQAVGSVVLREFVSQCAAVTATHSI